MFLFLWASFHLSLLAHYFNIYQVVRRDTGTIEHHFFRDLPKILDSSYLIVANNSKVVNCKLMPLYVDSVLSTDVEKTLVVYLLKQISNDRWLVSGDDELESKDVGFEVYIDLDSKNSNNSDNNRIIGTLVQIDDGQLEMVFRYESKNSAQENSTDLRIALQAAASIPLPPYIEPENAIKVSTL